MYTYPVHKSFVSPEAKISPYTGRAFTSYNTPPSHDKRFFHRRRTKSSIRKITAESHVHFNISPETKIGPYTGRAFTSFDTPPSHDKRFFHHRWTKSSIWKITAKSLVNHMYTLIYPVHKSFISPEAKISPYTGSAFQWWANPAMFKSKSKSKSSPTFKSKSAPLKA